MSLPEKLRIVILDCPYQTWENELTQKLFSRMVQLKFRGYQEAYGKNVLPIDSSDFAACHMLVCSDQQGELSPLMGFRSIGLNRCTEFKLPFPPLTLLNASKNTKSHIQLIEEMISNCRTTDTPLFYMSSWAIAPEIRSSQKLLVHQLTPFFGALAYLQHQGHPSIRLIAGGAVQFRVPNLLALLGFENAKRNGTELSQFGATFASNTPIQLMTLEKFSSYAVDLAEKYQNYWENRLVVTPSTTPVKAWVEASPPPKLRRVA